MPLAAAVLAATVSAASAQTPPAPVNTQSRGVIVLPPKAGSPPDQASPADAAPPTPPRPVPVVAPVIRECARPFAQPDVVLADAGGFDKALAAKLKGRRAVVVDLAQPYKMGGTPPPALAPWFAEVRASGGSVTASQYCQGARGMFGNWLSKLFGAKPGKPYKAVDGYNAVLHVNALDQQVTQLEFAPRDPGTRQ